MTMDKIYRHVTGFASDGTATYLQSGEVPPVEVAFQAGTTFFPLWGTGPGGAVVGTNVHPVFAPFFPSGHGTRFLVVRFSPQQVGQAFKEDLSTGELDALRRDAEAKLPGLFDVHASAAGTSASHATETVDYVVVLEGQLHLSLDSGQEVVLEPGHVVVQRGTRHTWSNQTDQPATMVVITLAASRAS
jgi:uncharacterized cupin superfamily protein